MAKSKPKVKPETEKARRARHWQAFAAATSDDMGGADLTLIEVAVRAATYATIPGKQKRNAAYMLAARELAVKAACRALRRAR